MRLEIEVQIEQISGRLRHLEIEPSFPELIRRGQKNCAEIREWRNRMNKKEVFGFVMGSDGLLRFQDRICVPQDEELREKILREAHSTSYSVHPGANKMYRDLRPQFWWEGMKLDIARFVAKCQVCQQVRIEHQRPGGTL